MSAATWATEGYCAELDAFTGELDWYVRLYVNDPVIDKTRVRADFVEAAYPNYAPFPITHWTKAALRGGVALSVPDVPIFTALGPVWPGGIRGYYVTWGTTGPLALAWRRPGDAFSFAEDRQSLTVFLRLQFPFALVTI